jgi:hypothetical protein
MRKFQELGKDVLYAQYASCHGSLIIYLWLSRNGIMVFNFLSILFFVTTAAAGKYPKVKGGMNQLRHNQERIGRTFRKTLSKPTIL